MYYKQSAPGCDYLTAVLSFPEGYPQNSHYSLVYCLSLA